MPTNHIVNLIFGIIGGVYSLLMLHFVIFGIISIFKRKKFPKTNIFNEYAIVIPARNEENVIQNIIKSIRDANYPQDKLHIFILAHNSNDQTYNLAKALKVTVYKYNNQKEGNKGYALKYIFEQIKNNYPLNKFAGFFVFDADNLVKKDFFTLMNDAFNYYQKKRVITSFRDSKNTGKNFIVDCYAHAHFLTSYLFSRGRTILDCSVRLFGPGYLVPSSIIYEEGWSSFSTTEDIEFSIGQIIKGRKISYCDEAEYIDEQPTKLKYMCRQRLRWQRGYLQCFTKYIKKLFKTIFTRSSNNRGSVMDITILSIPSALVFFFLFIFQLLVLCLCPLFDSSITYQSVFLNYEVSNLSPFLNGCYNLLISPSTGFLWVMLFRLIAIYFILFIIGAILTIMRGKKYYSSWWRKIITLLLWPIFVFIEFIFDLVAMFSLDAEWKAIPHYSD